MLIAVVPSLISESSGVPGRGHGPLPRSSAAVARRDQPADLGSEKCKLDWRDDEISHFYRFLYSLTPNQLPHYHPGQKIWINMIINVHQRTMSD